MARTAKKLPPAKRLALYRQRARKSGLQRVEVYVPAAGVLSVRRYAQSLRAGGKTPAQSRHQHKDAYRPKIAKTGKELYDFLRSGIGEGFDLELPPRPLWDLRDPGF